MLFMPTHGPRFVQYCGVSDVMAGSISSVMLFCASWGALLGGHLSDALTKPRSFDLEMWETERVFFFCLITGL